MYIGSAGPGPGGRTDGHGWAEGRADRRAAGMILNASSTIFTDFHKNIKNVVFFCRFASGGSASTGFYSSNKKASKKIQKKTIVFF